MLDFNIWSMPLSAYQTRAFLTAMYFSVLSTHEPRYLKYYLQWSTVSSEVCLGCHLRCYTSSSSSLVHWGQGRLKHIPLSPQFPGVVSKIQVCQGLFGVPTGPSGARVNPGSSALPSTALWRVGAEFPAEGHQQWFQTSLFAVYCPVWWPLCYCTSSQWLAG